MSESRMKAIGVAAWSILGSLLLLATLLWLLTKAWIIIPPIVIAIAIIYVLNPVVARLHDRGVARWMGSCLSYLVVMGLLTMLGFLVFPSIAEQGRDLGDNLPTIYDDLIVELESFAGSVGLTVDLPDFAHLEDWFGDGDGGVLGGQMQRITDFTLGVLEVMFMFLLAPVVAFYLLLDLPAVRRKALEMVPERHRPEVSHVSRQLGTAVGGFLRGQLFVALIVGVMTSVGLWAIDLPFWLLIGMIAGFLNIIPFVGPWVGGILGVLVALATRDLQTAFYAGLVALIVQQIDNNFISPAVLRATVRLHPAVIILGLILGASIGGFWGVLMAVPVMASIKIIVGHFWRTRVLGESWEQASRALIDDNPTGETLLSRLRAPDGPPADEETAGSS